MVFNYFNQNPSIPSNLYILFTGLNLYLNEHFHLFIQKDLLPPRPKDTNASFFHPQLLFLSLPEDNYNVDWYYISINGNWEWVNGREYYWPKHLEPGTNYTIRIEAYSWWSESYSRTSTYDGYIKTQRKHKDFLYRVLPNHHKPFYKIKFSNVK